MESQQDVCQEIQPLIAAYALEALDQEEHAAVEAHLEDCPNCRVALAEYEAVTEMLLASIPEEPPPSAVRRRLEAALRHEPAATRPPRTWPRLPELRAVMGAAVVVLIGLNLFLLASVIQLRQAQEVLREQLAVSQTALAVSSYPTSTVASLEGDQAFGTLMYDPRRRVAVLYAWGLPALPKGRAYQAWLSDEAGQRVSAAIFHSLESEQFSLVLIRAPNPVGEFTGFGVTIEPEGGSLAPTGERVMFTDL